MIMAPDGATRIRKNWDLHGHDRLIGPRISSEISLWKTDTVDGLPFGSDFIKILFVRIAYRQIIIVITVIKKRHFVCDLCFDTAEKYKSWCVEWRWSRGWNAFNFGLYTGGSSSLKLIQGHATIDWEDSSYTWIFEDVLSSRPYWTRLSYWQSSYVKSLDLSGDPELKRVAIRPLCGRFHSNEFVTREDCVWKRTSRCLILPYANSSLKYRPTKFFNETCFIDDLLISSCIQVATCNAQNMNSLSLLRLM